MTNTAILNQLSSFIDKNDPKLCTFLCHQWNMQQNAITYKELREAIWAGSLDYSYLLKWQQDYSDFVSTCYGPIAEKAIQQSATNLLGKYANELFDPQSAAIDSFIQTQGGKLIVEITSEQFKAINTLVRQASLTDTMTVDQLAYAIRPCIGLTTRQAQTVKNYYDNLIDQGYSTQDARKKQALYAEKVHRHRASMIAQTEIAFAYNAGADVVIRDGLKDGRILPGVKKRWLTSDDERVCVECGKLDMETVDLDSLFSNGAMLPPAHPNCRCAIAYDDVLPAPQPQPQPQPAAQQPQPQQPDPNYQPPEIPDDLNLDPFDFTYLSNNQMGTGKMWQYEDHVGGTWIFKPGQSKSGYDEPFRAYIQEAGYKVQGIVDPDSAVPCGVLNINTPDGNKFGAMQKMVDNVDASFNLKSWQGGSGSTKITPEIISQLQRENVTDWLMCNYDSHGGNFLLQDTTGKIIGVDKEQAFRYINNPGAQKMSYSFHPNSYIGETEPIYNTIYRKYAHGDLDMNLQDTLAYIKRVEAIPDAEYKEIFRDYAESLKGKGPAAEKLLDQIVDRKKNLRTTFETFYSELETERNGGVKTVFQFMDNAPVTAGASIRQVTMSANTLSGMSLGDLKTIAQQKGIKYAWNMNKTQLVDAISDPSKTAQIVQDAKNRAYGIGTTKKPKKTAPAADPATPTKKPRVDGMMQLGEAMDDFDDALNGSTARGVALISDSSGLESMQTCLRKAEYNGQECYELSGKLTYQRWHDANATFRSQTAQNGDWVFNQAQGEIDYTKPYLTFNSNEKRQGISTRYIKNGNNIFVIAGTDCENDARAMMGEFNIRIFASNGKDAAREAKAFLDQLQLDDIYQDVDQQALDRYKKMRLIWQNDPKRASKLDAVKSPMSNINRALNDLGITQQRVDKVRFEKVRDGYYTLIDPENIALAKKHDVAYIYHEAGSFDAAVSVIKSGELLSTTTRFKAGIFSTGASSSTDIETGGADSVFTRIVHTSQVGKNSRYRSFGNYVFVFDTEPLKRTDWYAYNSDEFGSTKTRTFGSRPGVEAYFDDTNKYYSRSNELLFRRSLPLTNIKEIRVPAHDRQPLIDRLKQEGISKINGTPIEQIIKIVSDLV